MSAVLFAMVVLALAATAVIVVRHLRNVAQRRDDQLAALRREIDVLSTLVSLHDVALERRGCELAELTTSVRALSSNHEQRIASLAEQVEGRPASRRRPVVVEVLSADGRRIG